MFNALRSEELLMGVGRVLRMVADASGALEEYERSQTLSAYSVTRLLAAEQAATAELLAWTRDALAAVLDGEPRRRVEAAADGVELGEALSDVLAAMPGEDPARTRIHAVLAEMIDREVAALAALPH